MYRPKLAYRPKVTLSYMELSESERKMAESKCCIFFNQDHIGDCYKLRPENRSGYYSYEIVFKDPEIRKSVPIEMASSYAEIQKILEFHDEKIYDMLFDLRGWNWPGDEIPRDFKNPKNKTEDRVAIS